jgi:AraC-like DNA-binding protein
MIPTHQQKVIRGSAPSFRAERYELDDEPKATAYSRRDFYKVWLINNKGTLKLTDREIAIDRPALVLLNPLTPYAFEPVQKKRTGYWSVFTEAFLNRDTSCGIPGYYDLFPIGCPNLFFPDQRELPVVNFLLEQIVINFNSKYTFKYQLISNQLSALLHEARKMQPMAADAKKQNAATRIAGSFLNLLEKQYPIATPNEPLKLRKPSDFADELAVHVNHLNAVVHEVTGKTTRDHIAGRMINESKALLNFSDWSVADIAFSLGFEYPNHFNTFFKKHTGNTPLSLRK